MLKSDRQILIRAVRNGVMLVLGLAVNVTLFQNCGRAAYQTAEYSSTSSLNSATDATPDPALVPRHRDLPAGPGHLTFNDEFDVPALDRSRWSPSYRYAGSINNELQFYAPDAFDFADGRLRIRAERREMFGLKYTSGAITTYGSFAQAYGYFEMRAKLPRGTGFWPAFWMTPQDATWPPEIDILELLTEAPTKAYLTYHWLNAANKHQGDGSAVKMPDSTADYHLYAIDWRPGRLIWFIDGEEMKRIESPTVSAKAMNIILNLALGGWAKAPDATTPFPAFFDIDWVRAYQYDDLPDSSPGKALDFALSTADRYVAKPGEQINFTINIRATVAHDPILVQALVRTGDSKTTVTSKQINTPALVAGVNTFAYQFTVPANQAPGVYRLTVGLFDPKWKNLGWLDNAVTFEVTR